MSGRDQYSAKGKTALMIDYTQVCMIYPWLLHVHDKIDGTHCSACVFQYSRLGELLENMRDYILGVSRETSYAQMVIDMEGNENGHA
jgi:hypothetical protein